MAITAEQQAAIDEVRSAAAGYEEAEDFYEGHVEELYVSDRVQQLLAKSGLNDLDAINFAKTPVDAVVNRLAINSVSVHSPRSTSGQEDTDAEDARATAEISRLISRNQLDLVAPINHRKACYLGDSYMFVWPVTDDSGDVVDVDIRLNSPQTMRVFYSDDDPLKKLFAVKVWTYKTGDNKCESRATFYYSNKIQRFVTGRSSDGKGQKAADWEPYTADGQEAEIDNPYGEVPVFHFRTDWQYGVPLHKEAYVPQIMINKLVVAHAGTIDFQSFPQRYFLLNPDKDEFGSTTDVDPDDPEDSGADPQSPFNKSKFRADPGAVWQIYAQSAGEFQAADPNTFILPFNRYVKAMAQTTGTPMHEFDPSGDVPSGESLKVAEAPLIKKVEWIHLMFGAEYRNMWGFSLSLLGLSGDVSRILVNWKPVRTDTGISGWQSAQAQLRSGVPARQVLMEMGYTPEQLDAWGFTVENPWGPSVALAQIIGSNAGLTGDSVVNGNRAVSPQLTKPSR